MAEINDEREREELFTKIIKSIKEYSTEEIPDLEKAKADILKLLKTHRPVKIVDFEYGLSFKLKENQRLIVKEENDKTKVREYKTKSTSKKSWHCTYGSSKHIKCSSSSAKIKYGILFASKNHVENCVIKEYSFVQEIQNLLKKGKKSLAHRLVARYKPGVESNQSLSTSMFNESNDSSTAVENNDTNFEESNLNETYTTISSNTVSSPRPIPFSVSLAAQTFSRLSVKREAEDNDYCMIIEEPAAKKPKIESNIEETFAFDLPSAAVLKEKCQKLKIEYNKEAYKFWGRIEFDKIITVSKNIQTHEFKSPNLFACLSLFFNGKSDSCFFIQHAINSSYRDELSASSSMTPAEIDQAFANITVSDDHLEFIAKFLECRIGIYKNRKLKKYGKWETCKNDALTLVMSFEYGIYSVVLNL